MFIASTDRATINRTEVDDGVLPGDIDETNSREVDVATGLRVVVYPLKASDAKYWKSRHSLDVDYAAYGIPESVKVKRAYTLRHRGRPFVIENVLPPAEDFVGLGTTGQQLVLRLVPDG